MGFYDDALAPVPEPPPSVAPSAPLRGAYDDALTPAVETPLPEGKVVYQGSVLPLSRTDQGKVIVDWSAGLPGKIAQAAQGAYQAFTLPGRALAGQVPMPPPGSTDPNAYTPLIPEATNFAAAFSPLNPAVRAGSQVIPGVATNVTRPLQPAPAAEKLFEVGGGQMDQFRGLPYRYDPAQMGEMANRIENRLIDKGIYQNDAPGIYDTLGVMRKSAGPQPSGATAVIAPGSLHSLRQNIANKFGRQGEHQLAPAIALDELDRFIQAPPPGAVVARPPAPQIPGAPTAVTGPFNPDVAGRNAGALFSQALGNLAGGYRGQSLADLQREIDLRTAAAGSGRNLDSVTRQKIASVLLDPKREKAFVPSEVQGLEQAVYGDPRTNRYRDISKTFGQGGGLGAMVAGGTAAGAAGLAAEAMGIPWWAGTMAAGPTVPMIGRALGNRAATRTQNALEAVSEATRRRTPYYQSLPPLPPQVPGLAGRDAIAHAMMLGAVPPQRLYVSPNRDEEPQ